METTKNNSLNQYKTISLTFTEASELYYLVGEKKREAQEAAMHLLGYSDLTEEDIISAKQLAKRARLFGSISEHLEQIL
jgi:hypothetical protein